jgi:hypothetical protein
MRWGQVVLLDCFSTELHYTTCCVLFTHKIQPIGEFSISPMPIGLLRFALSYRFF